MIFIKALLAGKEIDWDDYSRIVKNIFVMVIGLLMATLSGFWFLTRNFDVERKQYEQATFAAWMKLTGNTNLTFGEWKYLKDNRMLSGENSRHPGRND